MEPEVEIRRAETRYPTDFGWLQSRHCFSFGTHHDPSNVGHGLLIVSNDDRVAPGAGFGPHSHRDMEIVTWVLDGTLVHHDSEDNHGELFPGLVQRMSAGTGITHSEMNGSETAPVRFVQMWVPPDTRGLPPSYEERDMNDALNGGGLVPVASGGEHPGAVTLHQESAVMYVARSNDGEQVTLPDAPFVHLYVAKGTAAVDSANGSAPAHTPPPYAYAENAGTGSTGFDSTAPDNTGSESTGSDSTRFDNTGSGSTGFDNTGSESTGFSGGAPAMLNEGDAVRLTGAGAGVVTSIGRSEIIVWETHRKAER